MKDIFLGQVVKSLEFLRKKSFSKKLTLKLLTDYTLEKVILDLTDYSYFNAIFPIVYTVKSKYF